MAPRAKHAATPAPVSDVIVKVLEREAETCAQEVEQLNHEIARVAPHLEELQIRRADAQAKLDTIREHLASLGA